MATAEITVLGLGGASASASASVYIAEIQRRLAAQSLVRYRLGAMGTELEGDLHDILTVVGELHRVPLELGLPRAYTVLKLDERADKPAQTLAEKVESVERRLAAGADVALASTGAAPAVEIPDEELTATSTPPG